MADPASNQPAMRCQEAVRTPPARMNELSESDATGAPAISVRASPSKRTETYGWIQRLACSSARAWPYPKKSCQRVENIGYSQTEVRTRLPPSVRFLHASL